MKAPFKHYFVFSRAERVGSMIILSLIGIVLVITMALPYYVQPAVNPEEQRLAAAWEQKRKSAATANPLPVPTATRALFSFDPNTLDSDGFIRLGLSARTTHYLLNWRQKGKQFYRKEDLQSLYSLSSGDYERLVPFIRIPARPDNTYPRSYPQRYGDHDGPPLPGQLDLNLIDSATLIRMKGIGPFLAHRLIDRRAALGGFISTAQLMEVFRFPDSSYQYLCAHFVLHNKDIRQLHLNTATEEELARHPYIGEKMAKNIILLRSGLIKFENLTQLRQVPLMNEEKYRKIAPYCTID